MNMAKNFKIVLEWVENIVRKGENAGNQMAIFKFEESCRKVSLRVENAVGIGKVARYEQFFLFPQRFQKTCTADM